MDLLRQGVRLLSRGSPNQNCILYVALETPFLFDSLLFLTGGILNVFLKLYITGVTDYVVDFLKFRSL